MAGYFAEMLLVSMEQEAGKRFCRGRGAGREQGGVREDSGGVLWDDEFVL